MSSPLERRYRRVLKLLPVGYRRRWEEDMVAAFLESATGRVPTTAKWPPAVPGWPSGSV